MLPVCFFLFFGEKRRLLAMRHTVCKLFLLVIIGASCYPDLAFGEKSDVTVSTDVTPIHALAVNGSTNSSTLKESILTNSVQIFPQNGTAGKGDLDLNVTAKDDEDQLVVKTIQKKEIDDQMFNDFKRFLLFPFLPFLLPPGEEKNPLTSVDLLKPNENELKPEAEKPFILFDFAFNIREIPLTNGSRVPLNDSKIINVKKISDKKPPPTKEDELNDQKMRIRRNISKRDNPGFLDDFPIFSAPHIDDFFSKPNFFFPGLSEPKTTRKQSRRKRDMKKNRPDVRSDLQFLMDAIDQAFMQTKNDFEQADPVLNFLKGIQSPFGGDKKIDFMNGFPDEERPNVNWKIQRNVKRLNGEFQDSGLSAKSRDVPMIIVDKVVKIGQFHVDDDKNKLTKNKRSGNELKRKYGDGLNPDEVRIPMLFGKKDEETGILNSFSNLESEVQPSESKKRKRKSDPGSNTKNYNVKSREIRILPQTNTSLVNVGSNTTIELKKRDENTSESEKFFKMIDSMKSRIKIDLTNNRTPPSDRIKRKSFHDKRASKIPFHDDLKRNITQVLNRFFELVEKLDDDKLIDKLEAGEREIEESFDWTEKETLQNANVFGKTKRPKNELQFQEYLDGEKKERQVADLNYLFLTVTLPTILVFALVLLVCFFNLQVKGKIWTRLFRPRQIFVVEGKTPTQLNGSAGRMKSPQSI